MNAPSPIDCEQFDLHADELALGHVDAPLRDQLLRHATECSHCHSLLEGLGSVADRLLRLAPELEPAAGFEGRVLARLVADSNVEPNAGSWSSRGRRSLLAAAVASLAVLVLASAAFVALSRDAGSASAHAAIVVGTDREVGSADLVAEPTPHLLVSIDAPEPGPGVRHCELQRRDGTWEYVGWWDAEGIASGVWAVGVDPELLDAQAMRITANGDVVATATFG